MVDGSIKYCNAIVQKGVNIKLDSQIVNFGRAWAGNGCRKCFDFICPMHISFLAEFSANSTHLGNDSAFCLKRLQPAELPGVYVKSRSTATLSLRIHNLTARGGNVGSSVNRYRDLDNLIGSVKKLKETEDSSKCSTGTAR